MKNLKPNQRQSNDLIGNLLQNFGGQPLKQVNQKVMNNQNQFPQRKKFLQHSPIHQQPKIVQHALRQPSMLEYKLEKLLHDSSKRQQMYQQFIKKKIEQSYEITEKYFNNLQKYKQELDRYIQQKNKQKQSKFQKYQSNKVLFAQKKVQNKFKKIKLSAIPQVNSTSSIPLHKYQLNCNITLAYFLPIIQDIFKHKFPTDLQFRFTLPIKNRYLINNEKSQRIINAEVRLDQEEKDNLYNLINQYPFQLKYKQKHNNPIHHTTHSNNNQHVAYDKDGLKFKFTIVNEQENIDIFQNGKIWITIVDNKSKIVYAYSSLATSQFLYHSMPSATSHFPIQQWTSHLQFYCPHTHLAICKAYFTFQNQPILPTQNYNKNESNQPIQLASIKMQNDLYGDKESRMIQRINKFKNVNNSLLMVNDYNGKEKSQDEIFKNSNDKTLIMHRLSSTLTQMKQIQSINKYKQQHKSQYMSKILDQALQKYSLDQIELGVPKFLVFYHRKPSSSAQKIFLLPQMFLPTDCLCADIRKQTQISIVTKAVIQQLIDKNLISLKDNAGYDLEGNFKDGLFVFQENVAIIIKVLIRPNQNLQQAIQRSLNENQRTYDKRIGFDINLKIQSQVGQILSQQVYKLQPIQPKCQYQLCFHNYQSQQQTIQIPLNFSSQSQSSARESFSIICSSDTSYRVSGQNPSILQLKLLLKKVSTQKSNQNLVYVSVLDQQFNFVYAVYKIRLISYYQIKSIDKYTVGQICRYRFNMENDQDLRNQSKDSQKLIRVAFFTSHFNQATITCNGKQQTLIQKNKTYEIQLTYQSFTMQNNEERIIIHAIDIESDKIMRKWLLKIPKTLQDYKQVYQLKVTREKPTFFKYLLKNPIKKQTSFKFFCSNHSILTVPQNAVILNPGQQLNIQLEIVIRKENLTLHEIEKGVHVAMRVQGADDKGWNQLFKIFLN